LAILGVLGLGSLARADDVPQKPATARAESHEPAMLGVMVAPSEDGRGARVTGVRPQGPADKAGLQLGDVIIAVGSEATATPADLSRIVGASRPETKVEITYLREGKEQKSQVTLAVRPPREHRFREHMPRVWLGVLMNPEDGGVQIERVHPAGPAAKADVRPGDMLLKIDGRKINTPEDVRDVLHAKKPGDALDLVVRREGQEKSLKVTLGAGEPFPRRDFFGGMPDMMSPAAEGPTEPDWRTRTEAEIHRLHDEVQALRNDVKRLEQQRK
jgi:S1-C subfamily serine protease